MTFTRQILPLFGLALWVSACATPPPPPAPVIVAAPPPVQTAPVITAPAPVAPPPINIPMRSTDQRMSEALVRSASSHAGFMRAAQRAGYADIQTKDDLNRIMDDLTVAYSPLMGAGLTSYGALVAAQNTQFVDSVLDAAQNESVDRVVYQLYASPDYVTQFSGAYAGASDVASAWAEDKAALVNSAAALKQKSYDLQKDPAWKKQRADSRKERIAALKTSSSVVASIEQSAQRDIASAGAISSRDFTGPERSAAFWRAFGKTSVPIGGNPVMSRRMKKTLTLAALETLGATGTDSSAWIRNYATTPQLNQCTNWIRLHVEQCLAAGHYKYEDAYCIAEHQLSDTAECLTKSGY